MDIDPVIFADGTQFFESLALKYKKHSKGLFIMSPSGAGKTYYCNRQTEPNWIDGDELWLNSGAQPPIETEWWTKGVEIINRVEQRCDVITDEAVKMGFWIMGSVNYWYQPDAIVIPEWDTLTAQIEARQVGDYDGGLTSEHYDQLRKHLEIMEEWHTKHGVPKFISIDSAVQFLTKELS